jgi:hypothetical protein
MDREAFRNRMQ